MSRPFTPDWLRGADEATPFLACLFNTPTARLDAVRRAKRPIAPAVLRALAERNPDEASRPQLAALEAGDAVVVVTGQQTGLFLGPLYTLHKAASAIRVARALETESGTRVVPIFWLQTEDADFAEVRSAHVVDNTPEGRVLQIDDALRDAPDGGRVPMAHRPLGPSIDAVKAALADLLETDETEHHGATLRALLDAHYRPEATLPDAFAGLMGALFAEHGLLVFSPRDPLVADETRTFFSRALDVAPALDAALCAHVARLEGAGFHAQVPVRPGATLLCHAPDGLDGPRYRLCRDGESYHFAGRPGETRTEAQLRAALMDDPRRFSTTALLRPALQDHLLPTAAYIGGPGEIAYYAELGPVYAAFGMQAPLIVPRARLRLVTPQALRTAAQLGVDLAAPFDAAEIIQAHTPPPPPEVQGAASSASLAFAELFSAYEAAAPALAGPDAGLAKAVARTRFQVERQLKRLEGRFARARLRRDAIAQQRLGRLIGELAPGNAPQERTLSFVSFAARVGPAALVRAIIDAATPFEHHVKDVNL